MSSGSLTPEYKSAPEPEEPTDGGVSVVVGKNFDKIVKDDAKDVLLEVCVVLLRQGRQQCDAAAEHHTGTPGIDRSRPSSLAGVCPLVRALQDARANLQEACQAVC